MKKILTYFILSIAVSIFSFYFSGSTDLYAKVKFNNDDSLSIIQLENNWSKALVKHDEAMFEKYLAADLTFFNVRQDPKKKPS